MMNNESTRCQTTHYACECVVERMRKLEAVAEASKELLLQCESHDVKWDRSVFCRDCGYPDGTHKHNCAVGELWKALAGLDGDDNG